MTKCRYCEVQPAVVGGQCNDCWRISQCISETRACLQFMEDNPDHISHMHIVNLAVLRGKIGKIIDRYADRKKG